MVTPNGTNGINGFGGFDDERETLLHTALFKQVSSEEARELLPYLQHAEYDKGDFIFREGDTDHRMYLLEEGRVKLTRQSSDKRVQLLSIHGVRRKCWARFRCSIRRRTAYRFGGGDDQRHACGLAGT